MELGALVSSLLLEAKETSVHSDEEGAFRVARALNDASLDEAARGASSAAVVAGEEAIRLFWELVELDSKYGVELAVACSNLGVQLLGSGQTERAIEYFSTAIELLSKQSDGRTTAATAKLGMALRLQAERSGSSEVLDRAISTLSEALDSTADEVDRAAVLNSLGLALRSRAERTGSLEDLDRAIDVLSGGVDSTPPGGVDRAAVLNSLGLALRSRAEKTGATHDLSEAARTFTAALRLLTADHPHYMAIRENLRPLLNHSDESERDEKRVGTSYSVSTDPRASAMHIDVARLATSALFATIAVAVLVAIVASDSRIEALFTAIPALLALISIVIRERVEEVTSETTASPNRGTVQHLGDE